MIFVTTIVLFQLSCGMCVILTKTDTYFSSIQAKIYHTFFHGDWTYKLISVVTPTISHIWPEFWLMRGFIKLTLELLGVPNGKGAVSYRVSVISTFYIHTRYIPTKLKIYITSEALITRIGKPYPANNCAFLTRRSKWTRNDQKTIFLNYRCSANSW